MASSLAWPRLAFPRACLTLPSAGIASVLDRIYPGPAGERVNPAAPLLHADHILISEACRVIQCPITAAKAAASLLESVSATQSAAVLGNGFQTHEQRLMDCMCRSTMDAVDCVALQVALT